MKKLTYLFLAVGALVLASCQKPSEKAAGTYNGTYTAFSSTNPGTLGIAASGDNDNFNFNCSSVGIAAVANGVTASASGDNVNFTYSSTSTNDGDVTAVSGTLTGNSITVAFTYRAGGFGLACSFAGTK